MVSDGKTRYKLQQATRYGIPIVKQLFVEACVVAEQLLYDLHAKEYVPTFEYNECELVWAPSETALDSVDAVSWEYDTQSSSSDPQTTDEGDTEFLFHLAGVGVYLPLFSPRVPFPFLVFLLSSSRLSLSLFSFYFPLSLHFLFYERLIPLQLRKIGN
jgi:hypothetical protein